MISRQKQHPIVHDVLILRTSCDESSKAWQQAYAEHLNIRYSYYEANWLFDSAKKPKESNSRREFSRQFAHLYKLVSEAKLVVTDRLDASIFCVLVGKSHVIVDDTARHIYNARSSVFRDKHDCNAEYLSEHYASDPSDAMRQAVNIMYREKNIQI